MLSDSEDVEFGDANQSAKNLASLFRGDASGITPVTYVAPKQPKKDAPPKVVIAQGVTAYLSGVDGKWIPRGKMGVALLSTENTIYQIILYLSKTQQITTARITPNFILTPQANNYLAFQDDGGQHWTIMFDSKSFFVNFVLQVIVAKANLLMFKFDKILYQDLKEGEGSVLIDGDSVEINMTAYKLDNGNLTEPINKTTDNDKPPRLKIGKAQISKGLDDTLKGMKKGGHRLSIIPPSSQINSVIVYDIEVIRVKREKEMHSTSVSSNTPSQHADDLPSISNIDTHSRSSTFDNTVLPNVIERKRTFTDDAPSVISVETTEKNKMLERMVRMGGTSVLPGMNAFVSPAKISHDIAEIDDELIETPTTSNIHQQKFNQQQQMLPQFVPPVYMSSQQPHYSSTAKQQAHPSAFVETISPHPQQTHVPDYQSRPGSGMSNMSVFPNQLYPYNNHQMYSSAGSHSIAPIDNSYTSTNFIINETRHQNAEIRLSLNKIGEKVDLINEKMDTSRSGLFSSSQIHPTMETSILLYNIQRIVKENETMKKDLFERSSKIEDLNQKISELLERNQKLIEQSHHTLEQRNDVVNNVSEQTAQKILDLEKQKVELTNNLATSTSRISDIQLQLNQKQQDLNESTNKITTMLRTIDNQKDEIQKLDSQRSELQIKYDSSQDTLKNEKLSKKQLQAKITSLEDELAEMKVSYNTMERSTSDRKIKHETERKRLQDEIDELKILHENEVEDLRNKLRRQRTVDSVTTTQEISRIEQDLIREWQEKLDRQQIQHERSLSIKTKELDELKHLLEENDEKFQTSHKEITELKEQVELYEDKCEKLQERMILMKEKYVEMKDEQQQVVSEQVKRIVNIIFQKMKLKIKLDKSYTGENVLKRSLDIIKKSTVKLLSGEDEIQSSPSEEEEEEEEEENNHQNQQSVNQEIALTTPLDNTMVMIMNENNQTKVKTDEHHLNEENEQTLSPKNGQVDHTVLSDAIETEYQQEQPIKTETAEEIINTNDEQQTTSNYNQNGWDTVEEFQKTETTSLEKGIEQEVEEYQQQQQQQQNEVGDVDMQQADENESITNSVEVVQPVSTDETLYDQPNTNLVENTLAIDNEHREEENNEQKTDIDELSIPQQSSNENRLSDSEEDVDDSELFSSARPSIQDSTAARSTPIDESLIRVSSTQSLPNPASRTSLNPVVDSIPPMNDDDEEEDDLFK